MASHAQSSANRFAQYNDLSTDYDNRSHPQSSATQSAGHVTDSNSSNNDQRDTAFLTDCQDKTPPEQAPLRAHVERVVRDYFAALGDEVPTDLYELILKEIERPLLTVVFEQTRGNQTKCAHILGLNRGTLRKKLKTYNLIP